MPSDVKSLIKQARNLIAINDHKKAIETCQKILEIEESYIAHVFLGASYVNLDDCLSGLKHLQNAIRIDGSQALAYEGVCKLFEKFGKNLLTEKNFIKEVYKKMLVFHENDVIKTEATLLKFLKIFKSMDNQECLFTVINFLISNEEYLKEKDAKDDVFLEFLELVDKKTVFSKEMNEKVENVCLYVIKSGDVGEVAVERAWRIYFNIKMKNRDVVELWKLATEKCPLPCSAFNAEKALLIYMETYSDHKDTHMTHYEQVLSNDNFVLRLFHAFHYNEEDIGTAIESVNQVISEDKSLVVSYLLLSRLHLQIMNLEEAYDSAQKGLDAMKEVGSVFHCSEQQMSNLFRIEQLKSGFLKLKDQKIEPTKLTSRNKVTFYKTLLSVEQKQPYEQLEDEVYGLLDASMKEENRGGGPGEDGTNDVEMQFREKLLQMRAVKSKSLVLTKEEYDSLLVEVRQASTALKKTSRQYYLLHRYELLQCEGGDKLICKRSEQSSNIQHFVHLDDLYGVIMAAHLATKHGGRDKMLKVLEHHANVTRECIDLFKSFCQHCQLKRKRKAEKDALKEALKVEEKPKRRRGMIKCRCAQSNKQCGTLRCNCFREKLSCTDRCHSNLSCPNVAVMCSF